MIDMSCLKRKNTELIDSKNMTYYISLKISVNNHKAGGGPPLKVLCNKSPSPYFKFINPI
jgi:hypothetical protein